MIGAIAGDIIGSKYEWARLKTKEFELLSDVSTFTDDTVLTVAIAEHVLDGGDLVDLFHRYHARYPHAGWGGTFNNWALHKRRESYQSWGNGSAMRVSPVAWAFDTLEDVTLQALKSAEVTHDHAEGIRGAQATAAAIFLARTGHSKDAIRAHITSEYGYDLSRSLDELRPHYKWDVSCQGSVPESILSFLESTSYEDAVRNAISLGGDADTMACIAGGIAEAFYGSVPEPIRAFALSRLDAPMRAVTLRFVGTYASRFQGAAR